MFDQTMMGMYGQSMDPETMRHRLMMQMLMSNASKGGGQAGGANQLASGALAAFLMNPELGKSLKSGLGNWANGYQWDGMAGTGMQGQLAQQAANNVGWGGPL